VLPLIFLVVAAGRLSLLFCLALAHLRQQISESYSIPSIGDCLVANPVYWLFGRTSSNRASSGLVYQNRVNTRGTDQ
jgi:hypothetical protein